MNNVFIAFLVLAFALTSTSSHADQWDNLAVLDSGASSDGGICTYNLAGDKIICATSSAVAADSLDFSDFKDALTIDAATTLAWAGTTTTGLALNADSLTSGGGLAVASSGTGVTGSLVSFTLSGSNAGVTGNALKVSISGALATGTALMITNAGAGNAFRVNDDGTDTDTTPFVIDASGNVGIGTTTPASLLQVASTGYAQFSKTFAGSPTAADCDAVAEAGRVTYDTTGNVWYVCEGAGGWQSASANDGADNLGDHTATQALAMGTYKITNMADPTLAQDAATKAYVDLVLSGGGTAVYFRASGSSTSVVSAADTVIGFTTEISDQGGGLDHTTGAFTAPVSGFYQFNANAYIAGVGTTKYMDIKIRAGGSTRCQSTDRGSGADKRVACAASVYLAAGATADVVLYQDSGSSLTPSPVTSFSGFLIGSAGGGGADNFGNHTATTNIILGTNYLSGDGGSEGVFVGSTGNVGIGTTVPAESLEVAGSIKTSGTIQFAGNTATCSTAADIGKIRINTSTGKMQICR